MRRTALLVGAMLTALVSVSGVAWAITTIYCQDPDVQETCMGTTGDDEIIGTKRGDYIFPHTGNDMVRAGGGRDFVDNEGDVRNGKDVIHGGPASDRLLGGKDSERHYGGGGDDTIGDYYTGGPDVIRCGRGYDTVAYNEGVDTVAPDCEVLHPR